MACARYLAFEPVERPSWRKVKDKNHTVPKVSEMITQIIQYKNTWRKISCNRIENMRKFYSVQQEMYLEFLYQVQIGEEIGVLDRGNFEEIINDEVNKLNFKRGTKRNNADATIFSKQKYMKRSLTENLERNINSQDMEEKTQKNHQDRGDYITVDEATNGGSLSSTDSLPSSLDTELYMEENSNTKLSKTVETINLLRGYRHLKNELSKIPKEERSGYLGILDVESCIRKCHEILMKDLMDKHRTAPGRFSVLPRTTEFQGIQYFYPSYKTEDIAYEAVQAVVDQYNRMINEISGIKSEREKLESSFKCASVLLFSFLTLHPFSDGNGRLARLLCNHCLKVFCPFPTAIYNVFSPSTRDDYLNAIVKARKTLNLTTDRLDFSNDSVREAMLIMEQKPDELCSLIIESNWFTWRHFLRKIGKTIPLLNFEQPV